MKKYLCTILVAALFCGSIHLVFAHEKTSANEFIVEKKKNKKESSTAVKEDIGRTLEACHQQVSKNIIELAKIQQQTFDKIKDLVGACEPTEKSLFSGSIQQLKEQRNKLESFQHKLLQHQHELQSFLSCF